MADGPEEIRVCQFEWLDCGATRCANRVSWRRRESNPRPRPHRPNVYERSPRFDLARRPVRGRPADGPAILRCRTSGDWRSLGTEPDRWRPAPGLGPNRVGRRLT